MYKCPECGSKHRKVATMTTHIIEKHSEKYTEVWFSFVEQYFPTRYKAWKLEDSSLASDGEKHEN